MATRSVNDVRNVYEFLSAVAEGRSFEPSFEDGYDVQRVLAAIERADERGEWVAVE